MKKEEFIRKYGVEAYEKQQQQSREWLREHPEEKREWNRLWRLDHPEEVKANDKETRKGGKYYEKHKQYKMTGLPHEKTLVRQKHQGIWTPYKKIIAPESILHHEWLPNSADFRGVALVETDQHQHGYIDVIQILEGKITLFSEEEIRRG